MRVRAIGFDFLRCYCEPYAEFVDDSKNAEFVLTMNNAGQDQVVKQAREEAHRHGLPLAFWSIEDPNSFLMFLAQAKLADFVFTTDRECIPLYQERLRHQRVFWLPLAADCEFHHKPRDLAEDAAEFVFSGNWYDNQWEARRWGAQTVILPLARAGHSMAIFSYEPPPYPELKGFWRGGTSCRTTAEQYTHGKVVLGVNNQRSGMDGRALTVMTSMRTFEALACGKPFLASQSDAYAALGFINHKHMVWVDTPEQAVEWGEDLLANGCAAKTKAMNGMEFVRQFHTYGKRLERIAAAIAGKARPEEWR